MLYDILQVLLRTQQLRVSVWVPAHVGLLSTKTQTKKKKVAQQKTVLCCGQSAPPRSSSVAGETETVADLLKK
ncbi:hypothetical protein AOLI_G00277580 [Acnodon oligacanthus]